MSTLLGRLLVDDLGVTAIEYGLLAGLISVVIVAAADDAGLRVRAVLKLVALIIDAGQAQMLH